MAYMGIDPRAIEALQSIAQELKRIRETMERSWEEGGCLMEKDIIGKNLLKVDDSK